MTRCDRCGKETSLPFTCDHCGGKYCADCRLPPNHDCAGIGSWNRKPRPAVSVNFSKGGVSVTGGGYIPDSRPKAKDRSRAGLPYLKIMIVAMILILVGLAILALSGRLAG